MPKQLNPFESLQRRYISKTDTLFTNADGKALLSMLANGKNSYLRFDRFESSAMDMSWIKQIEDCIPAIGDIVQNPKKTIYTLSEVVQVEKAKRVTRESVQHLSSHTQFIKTVDENGNVTPSKILNVYSDDYYAIYENKFVATLLRHLVMFVEKRYDYILHQAELRDVQLLYMKNSTSIDGVDIDIETKVRYSKPAEAIAADKMKGFLKRIEEIRKYLKFYMTTEFMNILKKERDVRNPILQTNIIRKNPKYRKCYLLWLFIDRYREAGIEAKVEEKYSELSKKEIDEINRTLAINFITLKGRSASKRLVQHKVKKFKPTILRTLDDETFTRDVKYKGPIEFVRVDEKYLEEERRLEELNPHPNRSMARYNEQGYKANTYKREKAKAVDSLLSRSKTRIKEHDRKQQEALELEKKKELLLNDIVESELTQEAMDMLTKARINLSKKAQKDRK